MDKACAVSSDLKNYLFGDRFAQDDREQQKKLIATAISDGDTLTLQKLLSMLSLRMQKKMSFYDWLAKQGATLKKGSKKDLIGVIKCVWP